MPSKCPDRLKDRTDLYDCFIQPGVKKKAMPQIFPHLPSFFGVTGGVVILQKELQNTK